MTEEKSGFFSKLSKAMDDHAESTARQYGYQAPKQEKSEEEKRAEHEAARILSHKARLRAIEKAMSRNVSSGGAGMPYVVIDVIQAMATTGNKHEAPKPYEAMEAVKDQMWNQSLYLGGDAVLFARFEFKDNVAYSTNYIGVFSNIVFSSLRSGFRTSTIDAHNTLTVIGYGTVVKLMPDGYSPSPDKRFAFRPSYLSDIHPDMPDDI